MQGAKFCIDCGARVFNESCGTRDLPGLPSDASYPDGRQEFPAARENQSQTAAAAATVASTAADGYASQINTNAPNRCNCGQELVIGSQYCHRCGGLVAPVERRHVLVCRGMGHPNKVLQIAKQETRIGKSAYCDVVIQDDGYVSREHARIVDHGDYFEVEDAGSSNGTFIKVQRPVRLQPGDEILVGTHLLRFEEVSCNPKEC